MGRVRRKLTSPILYPNVVAVTIGGRIAGPRTLVVSGRGRSPGRLTGMSVSLYGESPGIDWRPVSSQLALARRVSSLLGGLPVLLGAAIAAALWTRWLWLLVAVIAGCLALTLALIGRQVAAISYVELPDEIVIRRGRLFRRLESIPYGRLQYADMQSGPMERRLGLASVTIHTANPESGGTIPGLPLPEAEALRERLTARGEAQRAGL